ncbi:hypothetical protein [Thermococcus prieurii]
MGLIDRLRKLLRPESQEFLDFKDMLLRKFEISGFLLATTEGLPIGGTLESPEELSAKLPELKKGLSDVEPSNDYLVITPSAVYCILQVTSDVMMLTKGRRILPWEEIEELKRATREELKL